MLEKTVTTGTKAASDAARTTAHVVEASIKKAWSILDAASHKTPPSEYLSQKAIQAIQGASHS